MYDCFWGTMEAIAVIGLSNWRPWTMSNLIAGEGGEKAISPMNCQVRTRNKTVQVRHVWLLRIWLRGLFVKSGIGNGRSKQIGKSEDHIWRCLIPCMGVLRFVNRRENSRSCVLNSFQLRIRWLKILQKSSYMRGESCTRDQLERHWKWMGVTSRLFWQYTKETYM